MKCSRCPNDAVEGKKKCEPCLVKVRQYAQAHKAEKARYQATHWWVTMITESKRTDIRKGLYDPDEHVDKELLQYQFEEQEGKCFYCDVAMITHSAGLGHFF